MFLHSNADVFKPLETEPPLDEDQLHDYLLDKEEQDWAIQLDDDVDFDYFNIEQEY
jgi:hypothetical protein